MHKNFHSKVARPFLGSVDTSPLLRFTEYGTITSWAIEGGVVSAEKLPQLQIWRLSGNGSGVYEIVNGSSTTVSDENIYDGIIDQQFSFREGDVLAVKSRFQKVLISLAGSEERVTQGSADCMSGCGEFNFEPGSHAIAINIFIGKRKLIIIFCNAGVVSRT